MNKTCSTNKQQTVYPFALHISCLKGGYDEPARITC